MKPPSAQTNTPSPLFPPSPSKKFAKKPPSLLADEVDVVLVVGEAAMLTGTAVLVVAVSVVVAGLVLVAVALEMSLAGPVVVIVLAVRITDTEFFVDKVVVTVFVERAGLVAGVGLDAFASVFMVVVRTFVLPVLEMAVVVAGAVVTIAMAVVILFFGVATILVPGVIAVVDGLKVVVVAMIVVVVDPVLANVVADAVIV